MESVFFADECPNMAKAELAEMAREKFDVKASEPKELDILVCADPNAESSKIKKARQNGTRVVSYDAFVEMLGLDDESSEFLTIKNGIVINCRKDAESVVIPAFVKGITKKAFKDCGNLKEVFFDGTLEKWKDLDFSSELFRWGGWDKPFKYIPAGAIKCTDGEVKIEKTWEDFYDDLYLDEEHYYEGDAYFYGDVLSIEDGVLTKCKKFAENVEIPDGVVEIGDEAFEFCENLVSVKIPEGVTKIGYCAFSACYSLESAVLPDSVAEIGFEAFSVCSALKSLVLGAGLRKIEGEAFDDCELLEEITFNGTVAQWKAVEKEDDWIFSASVKTVKCTDGEVSVYDDDDDGEEDEFDDEDEQNF